MNPRALGWDNHRKFRRVSLVEQTWEGKIRVVERARPGSRDGLSFLVAQPIKYLPNAGDMR